MEQQEGNIPTYIPPIRSWCSAVQWELSIEREFYNCYSRPESRWKQVCTRRAEKATRRRRRRKLRAGLSFMRYFFQQIKRAPVRSAFNTNGACAGWRVPILSSPSVDAFQGRVIKLLWHIHLTASHSSYLAIGLYQQTERERQTMHACILYTVSYSYSYS